MKRRVWLVGLAVSFALGCAEIYGLGDYTQQDGGTDASVDAAVESGSDSGNDASGNNDAGCGVCAPPLPGGWTFVAYDRAFRPSCANGYGTPTDVEEGLNAGASTCGCSCGLSTSCSSLLVTAGDGGSNGCNNKNSEAVSYDGGCAVLPSAISTLNESMSVTASSGGGCTPDASVVTPAVTYDYQGRICELVSATGGCDAGVCLPDPGPYATCVYQAGAVACPSGYPAQHLVGASVSDTRGCTPCTCGFDGGSCGGSAIFYTGAGCSANSQTVSVNGTCQAVSNQTFKSMVYQATGGGGSCTPSPTSPTGDAGFADLATVCCTQ
jgi:hypothetical protein